MPSPSTLLEGDPIPDAFILALQRAERSGLMTAAERRAELQAARRGPNLPPEAFGVLRKAQRRAAKELVMGLFDGGGASSNMGSSFDWGGLIGSLGSQVAGIYATKAQNKQLRRLMKLRTGGLVGSGSYGGIPVNTFAPAAGVPAATGGSILGPLAGAAAGIFGSQLLPELGDMLPGGLEESGTGLFGPDLFRVGAASQRQRMIDAVHPTSGERVYWRPVGRPIMFVGDAALLKRTRKMVRKMSSQAGCGFGGRTFRRRRR